MADAVEGLDPNPSAALIDHLRAFGSGAVAVQDWTVPNGWAPYGLSIVEMEPTERVPWWTFATVGCWQAAKDCHWRSEFVLSANDMMREHIELLKMAAFLHLSPGYGISLGKVVDIGQPWIVGSSCTHLLPSIPYPLGPNFEWPDVRPCTRFVWLLPITGKEAALAEKDMESLEQLFDAAGIAFADPFRACVAG